MKKCARVRIKKNFNTDLVVTLRIATRAPMPYIDYVTLYNPTPSLALRQQCPATILLISGKGNVLLYFCALYSLTHLPVTLHLSSFFFKDSSTLLRCKGFLSSPNKISHRPKLHPVSSLPRPLLLCWARALRWPVSMRLPPRQLALLRAKATSASLEEFLSKYL